MTENVLPSLLCLTMTSYQVSNRPQAPGESQPDNKPLLKNLTEFTFNTIEILFDQFQILKTSFKHQIILYSAENAFVRITFHSPDYQNSHLFNLQRHQNNHHSPSNVSTPNSLDGSIIYSPIHSSQSRRSRDSLL